MFMYITNFPHKQSRHRYKQNKDPNVGAVYISNFIHQHLALKDKSIIWSHYIALQLITLYQLTLLPDKYSLQIIASRKIRSNLKWNHTDSCLSCAVVQSGCSICIELEIREFSSLLVTSSKGCYCRIDHSFQVGGGGGHCIFRVS